MTGGSKTNGRLFDLKQKKNTVSSDLQNKDLMTVAWGFFG